MHRKAAIVVATTTMLALAGAGIAYAAVPDSNGVIHGCVSKGLLGVGKGSVRIVDGTQCTSSEDPLSWNQQGPKGDTGAVGPQGPAGTKGDKGDPGLSGTSHAYSAAGTVQLDRFSRAAIASISVPAGTYVVTATGQLTNSDSDDWGAQCQLGPRVAQEFRLGPHDYPADKQAIALQDVVTLGEPSTLTLSCISYRATAIGRLIATRIDTLN